MKVKWRCPCGAIIIFNLMNTVRFMQWNDYTETAWSRAARMPPTVTTKRANRLYCPKRAQNETHLFSAVRRFGRMPLESLSFISDNLKEQKVVGWEKVKVYSLTRWHVAAVTICSCIYKKFIIIYSIWRIIRLKCVKVVKDYLRKE